MKQTRETARKILTDHNFLWKGKDNTWFERNRERLVDVMLKFARTEPLTDLTCPNCYQEMDVLAHGQCNHCKQFCGCSHSPSSANDYCKFHRQIAL